MISAGKRWFLYRLAEVTMLMPQLCHTVWVSNKLTMPVRLHEGKQRMRKHYVHYAAVKFRTNAVSGPTTEQAERAGDSAPGAAPGSRLSSECFSRPDPSCL